MQGRKKKNKNDQKTGAVEDVLRPRHLNLLGLQTYEGSPDPGCSSSHGPSRSNLLRLQSMFLLPAAVIEPYDSAPVALAHSLKRNRLWFIWPIAWTAGQEAARRAPRHGEFRMVHN
ncbi:MAG: hypothetical protein V7646_293 [Pseudonocardia sp.]